MLVRRLFWNRSAPSRRDGVIVCATATATKKTRA